MDEKGAHEAPLLPEGLSATKAGWVMAITWGQLTKEAKTLEKQSMLLLESKQLQLLEEICDMVWPWITARIDRSLCQLCGGQWHQGTGRECRVLISALFPVFWLVCMIL